MTWATLDFHPTSREATRDCIAPPLLRWLATRPERAGGWRRLWTEKAGPAVGIKPRTVPNELRQMEKRGTVEARDLGDGDWDVRITDAGWAKIKEAA